MARLAGYRRMGFRGATAVPAGVVMLFITFSAIRARADMCCNWDHDDGLSMETDGTDNRGHHDAKGDSPVVQEAGLPDAAIREAGIYEAGIYEARICEAEICEAGIDDVGIDEGGIVASLLDAEGNEAAIRAHGTSEAGLDDAAIHDAAIHDAEENEATIGSPGTHEAGASDSGTDEAGLKDGALGVREKRKQFVGMSFLVVASIGTAWASLRRPRRDRKDDDAETQ